MSTAKWSREPWREPLARSLSSSRLLRSRACEAHASVGGGHVNQRAAGAHVKLQPARPHLPLHRHREIRLEATPFTLRLDVRRVGRGHRYFDPAVAGRDFQLPPLPNGASQLHLDSTVDGGSAHIAGNPFQVHSTVSPFESDL